MKHMVLGLISVKSWISKLRSLVYTHGFTSKDENENRCVKKTCAILPGSLSNLFNYDDNDQGLHNLHKIKQY